MTLQESKTSISPALLLQRATLWGVCLLALSGCAGLSEYGCTLQESRAQSGDLSTHYRYSGAADGSGPPPRGVPVKVTRYSVTLNVDRIAPCTTLSIIKELRLQRTAESDIQIRETREFYAEDGTLIATLTEDLTSQLIRSGQYSAVTPLPIPRAAPPGRYLITSRLTLERRGERRTHLLSAAEASFSIIPRRTYR